MEKKRKRIKSYELPENIQAALARIKPLISSRFMIITHYRPDAVFVLLHDLDIQPYVLARLVTQNPALYFETQAVAPRFIELRIFMSEWLLEHGSKRKLPTIQKPYTSDLATWIDIHEDAHG